MLYFLRVFPVAGALVLSALTARAGEGFWRVRELSDAEAARLTAAVRDPVLRAPVMRFLQGGYGDWAAEGLPGGYGSGDGRVRLRVPSGPRGEALVAAIGPDEGPFFPGFLTVTEEDSRYARFFDSRREVTELLPDGAPGSFFDSLNSGKLDWIERILRERKIDPLAILPALAVRYNGGIVDPWLDRFALRDGKLTREVAEEVVARARGNESILTWLCERIGKLRATDCVPVLVALLDTQRSTASRALIQLNAVEWAALIEPDPESSEDMEWCLAHAPSSRLAEILDRRSRISFEMLLRHPGVLPRETIRERLKKGLDLNWMLAAAADGDTAFLQELPDAYKDPYRFRETVLAVAEWHGMPVLADGSKAGAQDFFAKWKDMDKDRFSWLLPLTDLPALARTRDPEFNRVITTRLQEHYWAREIEELRYVLVRTRGLAGAADLWLAGGAPGTLVPDLAALWREAEARVNHGVGPTDYDFPWIQECLGKIGSDEAIAWLTASLVDERLPVSVRANALRWLPAGVIRQESGTVARLVSLYPWWPFEEMKWAPVEVRLAVREVMPDLPDSAECWTGLQFEPEGVDEDFLMANAGRLLAVAERSPGRVSDQLKDKMIKVAAVEFGQASGIAATLLKDPQGTVRAAACKALGMSRRAEFVPAVRGMLGDPLREVRAAAVQALVLLGDGGALPLAAELLTDSGPVPSLLTGLCLLPGELPADCVPKALEFHLAWHGSDVRDAALFCILHARQPWVLPLVRILLDGPGALKEGAGRSRWMLSVLEQGRVAAEDAGCPALARWCAQRGAEIIAAMPWNPADLPLLEACRDGLVREADASALEEIDGILTKLRESDPWIMRRRYVGRAVRGGVTGLAGALGLGVVGFFGVLALYRWVPVARRCVWQPAVRRVGSLGLAGPLLTRTGVSRRWLMAPCAPEDLSPDLRELDEWTWFDGMKLRPAEGDGEPVPAVSTLRDTPGLQVLEADSGQGKSTLLHALNAHPDEMPCVFLRAAECPDGILEAVQRRLPPEMRGDRAMLAAVLRGGDVRVLVDGLQEAGEDTRRRILDDAADLAGARLILSAQPGFLTWPETAVRWRLEPLTEQAGADFIRRQGVALLPPGDAGKAEAYLTRVNGWLERMHALPAGDPRAEAARGMLGNPMEATLAAELFAAGAEPVPGRLMAGKIAVMARDFAAEQGTEFPAVPVAERFLAWRRSGRPEPGLTDLPAVVAALQAHRLLRHVPDPDESPAGGSGRLRFRHDRVADGLMVPAFTGRGAVRQHEYAGDTRFRGVFAELAQALSAAEAEELEAWLWKREAVEPDGLAAWFQRRRAVRSGAIPDMPPI